VVKASMRIAAVLLFTMLLAMRAVAAEPEKLEKVVVSGMGASIDAARQNALRAAVEQVVGTHLLSDTMVENSQMINDAILSYSGGYVKQSRVISTRKDTDLFVVQVEAVVVSTRVRRKLEELNIAVRKVDGGSLFGEAATRIDEKRDGASLLGHLTRKFPQAAYRFAIGKPVIDRVDHATNKATVKVPVVATWDREFLDEYLAAVKNVARSELQDPKIMLELAGKDEGIVCIGNRETIKSVHADVCYKLDPSLYSGLGVKSLIYHTNSGSGADLWRNLTLSIKCKNASGVVVHRTELQFNLDNSDRFEWQFAKGSYKDSFDIQRNFYHSIYLFNYPNTLWRSHNRVVIVKDGEYRMTPTLQIDADKLKNITAIEVSLNQPAR